MRRPRLRCIVIACALASGPLAAGAGWLLASHPAWVESHYSRGAYPVVARAIGWLPARAPFAVAECLAGLAVAGAAFALGRGLWRLIRPSPARPRSAWLRRTGQSALAFVAALSALAALFQVAWGYNYLRQPFARSHGWSAPGGERRELEDATLWLARRLAADRAALPEDAAGASLPLRGSWSDAALFERVRLAWNRAAAADPVLLADSYGAKALAASDLFSRVGVAGITVPFTGEALVDVGPGNYSLPFNAAHEIAHQRGWAREDEANFLAFLVLAGSPDADLRYAADATAFLHAAQALGAAEPGFGARVAAALPEGFRRDRRRESAYWRRFQGVLQEVGAAVNDGYLKSQGQAEGLRSYGRMVDLLLAWRRQMDETGMAGGSVKP